MKTCPHFSDIILVKLKYYLFLYSQINKTTNPTATTTSTTFQINRPSAIFINGWKSNANAPNVHANFSLFLLFSFLLLFTFFSTNLLFHPLPVTFRRSIENTCNLDAVYVCYVSLLHFFPHQSHSTTLFIKKLQNQCIRI